MKTPRTPSMVIALGLIVTSTNGRAQERYEGQAERAPRTAPPGAVCTANVSGQDNIIIIGDGNAVQASPKVCEAAMRLQQRESLAPAELVELLRKFRDFDRRLREEKQDKQAREGRILQGLELLSEKMGTSEAREKRALDMLEQILEALKASPPSGPPAPAPPTAAVRAGTAPLTFEANRQDVALYIRTGETQGSAIFSMPAANYQRLCTAPCEITLPKGSNRLALSLYGGQAVEVERSVRVEGAAKLYGTYRSHQDLRIAGWWVSGAGVAALVSGLALSQFLSSQGEQKASDDLNIFDRSFEDRQSGVQVTHVLSAASVGAFLVGAVAGVLMRSKNDEARITMLPYAPTQAPVAPGVFARPAAVRTAIPGPSACESAREYALRAGTATGERQAQLQKIAARKTAECRAQGKAP